MTSARSKLAILAGTGDLPLRVAEAAAARGREILIISFEDAVAANYPAFRVHVLHLGQFGALIDLMRREGVAEIVMAGKVQRPDFRKLRLDRRGVEVLPGIIAAAARGDDRLIAHLVRLIEGEGFKVVAPETVRTELAAALGQWTRTGPDAADIEDIAKGFAAAKMLGALDVGQAAVVDSGLVLALEAAEGTDAMLRRVAGLPVDLRRRGVLVKCMKPGQERRVDLPAIGPETVNRAADARLVGIAVEAETSLVVDRGETVAAADRLGLFLIGVSDADLSYRR